jgi:hypothetical protein
MPRRRVCLYSKSTVLLWAGLKSVEKPLSESGLRALDRLLSSEELFERMVERAVEGENLSEERDYEGL